MVGEGEVEGAVWVQTRPQQLQVVRRAEVVRVAMWVAGILVPQAALGEVAWVREH